jgi:predicted XRE-type DNA-binding protein
VYTVRFKDSSYVLHAFQKRSTRGIATPKREIELVRRRLADAERHHRERLKSHGEEDQDCVEESSGNVFADRGLPNPEQEQLKAGLTLQIFRVLKARRLTQAQAGKVLGIPQPHMSDLLTGRARGFSAERLMDFLAALGHDVESG